jgi:hypothetical protein
MGIDLARRKASLHWYRMVPMYQSTQNKLHKALINPTEIT